MQHENLQALYDATQTNLDRGDVMTEPLATVAPHCEARPAVLLNVPVPDQKGLGAELQHNYTDDPWLTDVGEPCSQCGVPEGSVQSLRDRIGRMTRELHESLQELRLDSTLADVANEIPDARNRLKYVTEMCERSAKKVLDALDALAPMQESTRDTSESLGRRWDQLLENREPPDEGFMQLFNETKVFLAKSVERSDQASSLYTDIMMAQDFQDLTGQVCRKIEVITERIETQLLKLLVDTAPDPSKVRSSEALEGPQVVAGGVDAVNSQTEVDDLLNSLGF